MISEEMFKEMKRYADLQTSRVSLPSDDMADIADTGLKLWEIARAAQEQRTAHIMGDHDCFCSVCKSLTVLLERRTKNRVADNG